MRRSISPVNNSNTPSIVTSAGEVLAASDTGNRRGWMIQNVGQNPVFIRMGGTASTSVFHFVLKAGTADSDGLGGSYSETVGQQRQRQRALHTHPSHHRQRGGLHRGRAKNSRAHRTDCLHRRALKCEHLPRISGNQTKDHPADQRERQHPPGHFH